MARISKKVKELTDAVTSTSLLMSVFLISTVVLAIIVGLAFGTDVFCNSFDKCNCSTETYSNNVFFEKLKNEVKTLLGTGPKKKKVTNRS